MEGELCPHSLGRAELHAPTQRLPRRRVRRAIARRPERLTLSSACGRMAAAARYAPAASSVAINGDRPTGIDELVRIRESDQRPPLEGQSMVLVV